MRHVQLIAISGAIGSSVFISIGNPLTGGPLALLIGVSVWSSVVWALSNCLIEMCTLLPVDGGFVHYADRFLDPAVGFSLGWNYFISQVALICSELTAFNIIVAYWDPNLNPAICIATGLVLLVIVQVVNVRVYGESEFWISILKVFMIFGAFLFTIITMCGANPIHDRYGFRYWKDPGPFASSTASGRAYDVWKALQWGAFAITGPDYIALVAGEVKHPRRVIPKAYRATIFRIIAFYIGGAFFVGINAPSNSHSLLSATTKTARSPYVINMTRLKISSALPSVLSAGLLISLFSSGSSMAFAASRTLYALAIQGQAPKFVARTNRHGLPYVCVLITLALGCLSFLALSSGTSKVLVWLINLTTATQLLTQIVVAASYIRFRAGMKAQNLGRDFLPAKGYLQPWSAWYVLFWASFALIFSGYFFFAPGKFSVTDFLFTYGAVFIFIALFILWKCKGARHVDQPFGIPAIGMDFTSNLQELDEMTRMEDEKWASEHAGLIDRIVDRIF
ncbi:general amino acid permease agp2 [Vanrija albida]|uniref:General amino acid permease agp2 n=1 Tax=Vanrija albida TaxID=181172 RepID=A0ABR3PZJ0_9TREE